MLERGGALEFSVRAQSRGSSFRQANVENARID